VVVLVLVVGEGEETVAALLATEVSFEIVDDEVVRVLLVKDVVCVVAIGGDEVSNVIVGPHFL